MTGQGPAEELKALRLAAALTQEQAAPLLGVSTKTLSRWETGSAVKPSELANARRVYGECRMSPGVSRGTSGHGSLIREAMTGGAEAVERLNAERLFLAEFRVELVRDLHASDEEIAAALALVRCSEARAFMNGDAPRAMEMMAGAVRIELARRQAPLAPADSPSFVVEQGGGNRHADAEAVTGITHYTGAPGPPTRNRAGKKAGARASRRRP
ncbi:MAG: Helix-turn-helix domain [Gemmatimonadetes bacterium]|nr:Helix-turn-helix domain [Gemmatimonadota bacterium]